MGSAQNINTVGILEIRETIDDSADHGGEKCDGNSSDDLVGATASYSFNGDVSVDLVWVTLEGG